MAGCNFQYSKGKLDLIPKFEIDTINYDYVIDKNQVKLNSLESITIFFMTSYQIFIQNILRFVVMNHYQNLL